MLTDHSDAFAETEFPEALLFRPALGDTLVERAGSPVANRMTCADRGATGRRPLILAGTESGVMAVGLERHLRGPGERGYYSSSSSTTRAAHHEAGGLVLAQHTEDWTVEELSAAGFDGFEMYNLHANTLRGAGVALQLLVMLGDKTPGLPTPDSVLLPIWSEDERYLTRWGSVLARGVRRVTTMGTDCHRNTFKAELQDGERIDSYRRMMSWLANHLLVRPEADGSWDDRHLKAALAAGRLYGVLETAGTPVGFEYVARTGEATHEMGERVALAETPVLRLVRPTIKDLDPLGPEPALTLRILKARPGGFDEVARGSGAVLEHTVTATGAYRAEIRMVPHHLAKDLGSFEAEVLARDVVWIYANPIYVE